MQTLHEELSGHPFLSGMEERLVGAVADCAHDVTFEPGRTIFRQGEEANEFYLITRGRVAVEMPVASGGTMVIQTLTGGAALGWSWLVPPHRWRFDARSVELTHAVAFDGRCLRGKIETDHDLGYELLRRFAVVMAQRIEASRIQLIDVYGAGI